VSTELERALPALREAEEALNVLTKKDISELKVCGPRLRLCAPEAPVRRTQAMVD